MATRYLNVSEVPLALGVFLATDNYEYNSDPNTISTTTLLKPVRQIILAARLNQQQGMVNLIDQAKNRVGAAIHDGIENAWKTNHVNAMLSMGYPQKVIDRIKINPDPATLTADDIPVYLEQRLSKKIGRWTVTGKFDFVGEGKVQDFKSTATYSYTQQVSADKYIQQGSIYRWLNPKMITQPRMEIHYIFTDWKASLARNPEYPPKPVFTQGFDLMSLESTEAFIQKKLQLLDQYSGAPESDIPKCTEEDLWRSDKVFKYYKNPEKVSGRSTKNFDTMQEALIRLSQDKHVGIVKEVPGEAKACKYCPAFALCSQKDELIASGDLTI